MIQFTEQEKIAIANILIETVNADGKVDINEVMYLAQLKKTLEISNQAIETAAIQYRNISVSVLKDMDDEKKLILGQMIIEMSNADGHFDDTEKLFFIAIASLIDMPIHNLNL